MKRSVIFAFILFGAVGCNEDKKSTQSVEPSSQNDAYAEPSKLNLNVSLDCSVRGTDQKWKTLTDITSTLISKNSATTKEESYSAPGNTWNFFEDKSQYPLAEYSLKCGTGTSKLSIALGGSGENGFNPGVEIEVDCAEINKEILASGSSVSVFNYNVELECSELKEELIVKKLEKVVAPTTPVNEEQPDSEN